MDHSADCETMMDVRVKRLSPRRCRQSYRSMGVVACLCTSVSGGMREAPGAHVSVQDMSMSYGARRSTVFFRAFLSPRPQAQSSSCPVSRSTAFQSQHLQHVFFRSCPIASRSRTMMLP